jgi:hypothetical protein
MTMHASATTIPRNAKSSSDVLRLRARWSIVQELLGVASNDTDHRGESQRSNLATLARQ